MVLAVLRAARFYRKYRRPAYKLLKHVAYNRPSTRRGYHTRAAAIAAGSAMAGYGFGKKTRRRRLRRRRARRRATRGYVHRAINSKQDVHTNYLLVLNSNITSGNLYNTILGSSIEKNSTAGVNSGNRIGDSIFYKGFKLHIFFRNLFTTPIENNDCMLRFLLVKSLSPADAPTERIWQRESDTNTPLNFDVLGNTMQMLRKVNRQRFKVIRDWKYNLHAPNQNKGGSSTVLKKLYFPINRRITYNTEINSDDKIRPQYLLMWFLEFRDGTVPAAQIEGNIKMWEFFNP